MSLFLGLLDEIGLGGVAKSLEQDIADGVGDLFGDDAGNTIQGLFDAINTADKFFEMLMKIFPVIFKAVIKLLPALEKILEKDVIEKLVANIVRAIPLLLAALEKLLPAIVDAFSDTLNVTVDLVVGAVPLAIDVLEEIVVDIKCFETGDFFNPRTCPFYMVSLKNIIKYGLEQGACSLTAVDVHSIDYQRSYNATGPVAPPHLPFLGDRSIRTQPGCYITDELCTNATMCDAQPLFKLGFASYDFVYRCLQTEGAPLQCVIVYGITVEWAIIIGLLFLALVTLVQITTVLSFFQSLLSTLPSPRAEDRVEQKGKQE